SGASGDMLLGALVDAGLSEAVLREELGRVDLTGYRLEIREHQDQGITGTRLNVSLEAGDPPSRRLPDILHLLETSHLDGAVVERASDVFRLLARAEAAVHGTRPEEVHFHEVGAVDAIVDVVGTVAGLRALGVEAVYASALPLGAGFVESQHGTLPLPAPGTLEILASVGAPT